MTTILIHTRFGCAAKLREEILWLLDKSGNLDAMPELEVTGFDRSRYVLTGPEYQAHLAAAKLGRWARVEYGAPVTLEGEAYARAALDRATGRALSGGMAVVLMLLLLAGDVVQAAGDGDPGSRSGYLGGSPGARTTGREVGRKEAWRDGFKGILKYFSTGAGTITTFQPYNSAGYISEDGICCTDRWQIGVLNYSSGTQQRALIDTVERSFAPLDSAGRLIGGV